MKKILLKIINHVFSFFNLTVDTKANWLRKKENFIAEITDNESIMIKSIQPYTMNSISSSWAIIQSIKHINEKKIEGDIVECGVFRGGNIILTKMLCNEFRLNKKIFAYDTFDGMPEPTIHDRDLKNIHAKPTYDKYKLNNTSWCKADLNEVKSNILKFNFDIEEDFYFIKGKVEETLKIEKNIPEKIALLILDTDFYDSTKIELEVLYPRLQKGGILIIDDYGHWKGSKKAVDEYFNTNSSFVWMHRINYASRLLIK